MSIKEDFFKDMAVHLDIWTETGVKALTEKEDDLMWSENIRSFEKIRSALAQQGVDKEDIINILSECLRGISHSFLTILDGATSISNDGRKIFLVDERGHMIGEGLHEEFMSYLLDTDRLK